MLWCIILYSLVHQSFGRGYNNGHGIRGHGGHGNHGNNGYNGYLADKGNEWHHSYKYMLALKVIPYLDRNGCRFPGDVVCNPADTDSTTYGYCVLSDEGKNLWKKPSMQIVVATCAPAGAIVLSDWCNDNERLLRAMGFIRNKEKHPPHHNHQKKYTVMLQPCILVAPPAPPGPYKM